MRVYTHALSVPMLCPRNLFILATPLVETSHKTQTALVLAHWCRQKVFAHVCVPCILATATIQGQRLFHSELPIVWLLFKGGVYLRAATIRGRHLFEEIGQVLDNNYSNCPTTNWSTHRLPVGFTFHISYANMSCDLICVAAVTLPCSTTLSISNW